VTLRIKRELPSLRQTRAYRALSRAFLMARERFGMRLVHYSIQGNHLHLVVEAEHREALRRGMQGLAIRMARALNHALGRSGKVFADRYHAHMLRTPPEVKNAVAYVLGNRESHWRRAGHAPSTRWRVDLYSSAALGRPGWHEWVIEWLRLDPARQGQLTAEPRTGILQRAAPRGG
jgi:putative transposase